MLRGKCPNARPPGRLGRLERSTRDRANWPRISELSNRPGRLGGLERSKRGAGATPPKTALARTAGPFGEVAPENFPCRKAVSDLRGPLHRLRTENRLERLSERRFSPNRAENGLDRELARSLAHAPSSRRARAWAASLRAKGASRTSMVDRDGTPL